MGFVSEWSLPAIAQFDAALQANPKYTHAQVARGDAYAAERQDDKAIADYDAAQNDNRRAIADFSDALRLTPGAAEVLRDRSRAYAALGNERRPAADDAAAERLGVGS